jgi:hypothetical protein
VDIITLASGFNQGHGGMEAEIRRANIEGILTFAAASNHGNTEYITFPANMTGHVMAMFASNGNATVTNEFNPAPSRHSLYNFALPGEQVRAHPLGDLQDGTSISTFIGAAIAGLVLDFANQRDGVKNIRFREHLNKVDGTTAIFAEMAIGGESMGYNCVAPWKLRASQRLSRDEERMYICNKISLALEARNR